MALWHAANVSSEATRDVALGTGIAWVRKDLLGIGELDEPPNPMPGRVDLGSQKRRSIRNSRGLLHVVRDNHDRVLGFQ